MPVLVTGVEDAVGWLVVRRLRAQGGEVRAFCDLERPVRADVDALRALRCKVAQGALDDEGHVESALTQAHTVLHLATSPLVAAGRLLDAAATVVGAAVSVGARRLVLLSSVAAAEPAGDPWLEALAEAEAVAAAAPLESVILRCAPTYGPVSAGSDGSTALLAAAWGDTPLRPLWAGDVADLVVATDRDRVGADRDLLLRLSLAGPEELPAATFAARLRAAGVTPLPTPGDAASFLDRSVPLPEGWLGRDGTPPTRGLQFLTAAGTG